jgi:Ca2+-dependent lipid-binding protein
MFLTAIHYKFLDPYTKIWLHYRGQRTEKKKTGVKKNTLNPEFNEQFEFYIPMEKLKDYTLEIIVMDKDRIGRNECIGKV